MSRVRAKARCIKGNFALVDAVLPAAESQVALCVGNALRRSRAGRIGSSF